MHRSVPVIHPKGKPQKIALIFLGIVLMLLMLRALYRTITNSTVVTSQTFSVAISSDPVMFLYLPKDAGIVIVTIPSETYTQVPYGFGTYRIGAVHQLAQLQKKPELMSKTVEMLLGVPVFYMFITDEVRGAHSVASIRKNLMSISFIVGAEKTNIPLFDRLLLMFRLLKTPVEKITLLDLADSSGLNKSELPDGSIVLRPDYGSIDRFLGHLFEQPPLRVEDLTVAVHNASSVSGIGNFVGRMLTNSGIRVVTVGNSDEQDGCFIRGARKYKNSATVRFISTVMPCTFEEGSASEDLDIIVGSSYAQRLY